MIHWLRGLWRYYLAYTKRPLHTATAAAFAIFALLVFVDPLFAALAVGSYVLPPVVLYVLEGEPMPEPASRSHSILTEDPESATTQARRWDHPEETDRSRVDTANGDTDSDSDDDDTDSDSDDGDTDSDSDDGDTDSDSDDGDTDSDSDDGDTDTDRVGTDTDSDRSG
ncbi:hypothetical protein [Natrononativus amylolyticus]|uniref:hypothetical protein n=1 Tax=Natrononativus amylolyticus TaxID=2963434 RepID=UPI0020CE5951|nr:hypothetical protein [Natrononativus amylolyticus]